MSRNGSGSFSVLNTFVSGTTGDPAPVNANFTDVGAEITNSLPRDGQAGMTGQFKATSGTVAAPGIAFTSDTDSGWYRIGGGNLGLAIDGVKVLDVDSDGLDIVGTLDASTAVKVNGVTVSYPGGTDIALADGGTGASLADPNADRIMFWDDSGGAVDWLSMPAAGLAISGTSIALANDLAALEALSTTGLVARTGSETYSPRSIASGIGISFTNGDGVSGNPTPSLRAITQTVDTTNRSTTNTSYETSNVSAAITPSSTSAKVLIRVTGLMGGGGGNEMWLTLLRGVTALTPSGVDGFIAASDISSTVSYPFAFEYLDSPNTTSATTYAVHFKVSAGTGWLGRRGSNTTIDVPTIITLTEVA
jgi:hypothetical protein